MKSYMYFSLIALFGLLISSCSSEKAETNLIDYDSIPLLELEPVFSFTESDEYLPSTLMNLLISDDSYILVAQRNETSVHQFDSLGNYLARVAGPGQGPGELSQRALPHSNGKILVMSNNHGIMTEYRQNEHGIFEYYKDYSHRALGPVRAIPTQNSFKEFYISRDSVNYPFLEIPPEFTTEFIYPVKITGDSLELGEKILSLKRHSSYIEISDDGNAMSYSYLPYRYSDWFSALPNRKLLVWRPDKAAIQIYDSLMNLEHELILNIKNRFVTDDDMEFHFPNNTESERRERRKLIRDVKPPFTGVIMDNHQQFWLHTDKTANGNEFVVLNYEGEPLGRVLLPVESTLHQVRNNKLYIINNTSVSAIEAYSVSL